MSTTLCSLSLFIINAELFWSGKFLRDLLRRAGVWRRQDKTIPPMCGLEATKFLKVHTQVQATYSEKTSEEDHWLLNCGLRRQL